MTPIVFAGLAAGVVAIHAAFVLFATLGGLLTIRWPRVAWAHVPCLIWAAYIELSGHLCPLTPLENILRERAGLDQYSGDFVARYVFPVLYPEGLTRSIQITLGVFLLGINAVVYWRLLSRTRRRSPER
jgi:hypothetical protein